jgi:integrase
MRADGFYVIAVLTDNSAFNLQLAVKWAVATEQLQQHEIGDVHNSTVSRYGRPLRIAPRTDPYERVYAYGSSLEPKTRQSKAPVSVIVQLARLLGSRRCLSGNPANGLMFASSVGKPINLDALAADVIVPLVTKAGVQWHGWHAFRRGLATNLHQLGVSDKTVQRILRHSNVTVTQNCYIKTADSQVVAEIQQFERSLVYAPNMHLSGVQRTHLM